MGTMDPKICAKYFDMFDRNDNGVINFEASMCLWERERWQGYYRLQMVRHTLFISPVLFPAVVLVWQMEHGSAFRQTLSRVHFLFKIKWIEVCEFVYSRGMKVKSDLKWALFLTKMLC